jgi:hypothetical protein
MPHATSYGPDWPFTPKRREKSRRLPAAGEVTFPANVYASRMPNPPKSMTTRLPLRTAMEVVFMAGAIAVAVGGG